MPTYSYRCANCDFAFDQYQAFTDDSLTVCPNCGQPQLRKVFNAIGVSFTGSGFYQNDSRAARTSAASGSGKSGANSSSDKSSSSSSSSGDSSAKPKADASPVAKPSTSTGSGSASSGKSGSTST